MNQKQNVDNKGYFSYGQKKYREKYRKNFVAVNGINQLKEDIIRQYRKIAVNNVRYWIN
jgi:hypothetical protein